MKDRLKIYKMGEVGSCRAASNYYNTGYLYVESSHRRQVLVFATKLSDVSF